MEQTVDYGWRDWFIAKPATDAVEIDATKATVEIDIQNSLDEKYHFEVSPKTTIEQARYLSAPKTNGPGDKREKGAIYVQMHFPFMVAR